MPEKKWIFDTVVLSNFLLTDSIGLLKKRYSRRAIVAWEVYDEITAGQAANPDLKTIDELIEKHHFELCAMSRKERQVYSGLISNLGRGEAASIALAQSRKAIMCTDDKAARKECSRLGAAFTGTIGILKAACTESQIAPAQADSILGKMVENGFYSPVRSISSLV